jgi:hypothetical protein
MVKIDKKLIRTNQIIISHQWITQTKEITSAHGTGTMQAFNKALLKPETMGYL